MESSLRRAALAVALGALAAVALVACGDDDAQGGGAAGIISAITFIDGAGLHDIDTSINEDKTIPAAARSTALKLQTVALLTEWPAILAADGKAMAGIFGEMAAALDGDDPDVVKAGAAAKKAHDGAHDFSGRVWTYLKAEAGIEGSDDHHD